MKKATVMLMSIILITGVISTASAATRQTLCGVIYPDNVNTADQFILSVIKNGQPEEKNILTNSKSGQDFISAISVHGGRVCNPRLPSGAPASVCIQGNLDKLIAEKITCQNPKTCHGINCM